MGAHKERRPELKGRERVKDKGQMKRLWCQGKKLQDLKQDIDKTLCKAYSYSKNKAVVQLEKLTIRRPCVISREVS